MVREREVIMSLDPHQLQPPVFHVKAGHGAGGGEGGGGGGGGDEKVSKSWYMMVIALLYVGLIISFCLNVTLLLRDPPPSRHVKTYTGHTQGQISQTVNVNVCTEPSVLLRSL